MAVADEREPGTPRPRAGEVGERLRARREDLRITASTLAARVAMSQAKISRIETGRTTAGPEDVRRIAETLQMPAAEIEELVGLATTGRRTSVPVPDLGRAGDSTLAKKQSEVGRLEREAREVRVFQPAIVPGLLQNSDYAKSVMGTVQRLLAAAGGDSVPSAVMKAVGRRIDRQQILAVPEKKFYFLLMESALSNRLSRPANQLDQIERIREVAAQDNVWLGIVPADATLGEAPLVGFELIDEEWLIIDLIGSSMTLQSVADIRIYRQYFDSVAAIAVTEIDEILDKYADLYHKLSARR